MVSTTVSKTVAFEALVMVRIHHPLFIIQIKGELLVGVQSKIYSISDDKFRELVMSSKYQKDVANALGFKDSGNFHRQLYKRCAELGISLHHFPQRNIPIDEILVEHSSFNRTHLLERLFKEKIKEYKCERCGNTGEWQGERLSLQIHHINGIANDNRLENIQILCPNCHSLTDTYAGKNVKKIRNTNNAIKENNHDN